MSNDIGIHGYPSGVPLSHDARRLRIIEAQAHVVAAIESSRLQRELIDVWVEAMPAGTTREDLVGAARQLVALAERHEPRRGLCRFGRPT